MVLINKRLLLWSVSNQYFMQVKERGIILIPIDFTKQSLLAINQSYNLAKYTHSKLVLLHAYSKKSEENKAALEKLAKETEKESESEKKQKKNRKKEQKLKKWKRIFLFNKKLS